MTETSHVNLPESHQLIFLQLICFKVRQVVPVKSRLFDLSHVNTVLIIYVVSFDLAADP